MPAGLPNGPYHPFLCSVDRSAFPMTKAHRCVYLDTQRENKHSGTGFVFVPGLEVARATVSPKGNRY